MRKPTPKEYSKDMRQNITVGEVIQLAQRAIAPATAGARFAVVVSIVALVVSCAALVRTFVR